MNANRRFMTAAIAVAGICLAQANVSPAADELGRRASWSEPTAEAVKAELDEYLAERDGDLDELTRTKIDALWPAGNSDNLSGVDLLEQLAATIALVDSRANELVQFCRSDHREPGLPTFELLADESVAPLVRNNLRLLYARWLSQKELYDESLEAIKDVEPEDVVDPASLLFYQSVGYHRMMDKENCLPAIEKLLENEKAIPRRYATVARLMEADLKPLKTESLDEIARLMDDIDRRLGLGRAGKTVRKQEEDVVAKLEKLIEEMEKGRPPPGGGPGGGNNPSSPMPDSMLPSGGGPGNVDQKKIGKSSGWGNLPPKQRQEALQQISKEFPSHFREAIEEYFRKLAREGTEE